EARAFLDAIGAWQFIGSDMIGELDDGSRHALFSMIARSGYIYDAQGRVQPALQQLLQKDTPFFQAQSRLDQKSFSVDLVGASPVKTFDESLFLIDSVFYGRMGAPD